MAFNQQYLRMPSRTLRLQRLHLVLMGLLFFSLLGALLMSSDALQTSTRFGHLYSLLLVVSGTGLVVLVVLIVLNLRHLIRQVRLRRERRPEALAAHVRAVSLRLAPPECRRREDRPASGRSPYRCRYRCCRTPS